jgi:hypothetical protein
MHARPACCIQKLHDLVNISGVLADKRDPINMHSRTRIEDWLIKSLIRLRKKPITLAALKNIEIWLVERQTHAGFI